MNADQIIVLIVLAGAMTCWIAELVPLGLTGISLVAILGLSGAIDASKALQAFSSPAVVLVGALYVLSAALIRTGVVAALEDRLIRLGAGSEKRVLIAATLATALVSGLLNNTSVVVLMLPLLLGAARRLKIPPSRLLMPVSFAAILGGMLTLIGTSTNVLVANLARDRLTIGFFDFLPFGAAFLIVGLAYLWLVAPRLLPSRPTISSVTHGEAFEYVTELLVRDDSRGLGLTRHGFEQEAGGDLRVLQHLRGEEALGVVADTDHEQPRLAPGDVIVVRATPEFVVRLCRQYRFAALPDATEPGTMPQAHGTTFAEIVITPVSPLVGQSLASVGLFRTFGVIALALLRRGAHLRRGIVDVALRAGDVILVHGAPEKVEGLRGRPGFLLLIGVDERIVLHGRAPMAIGIAILFVAGAASGMFSLPLLAVAVAVACIATGCLAPRLALREINWNVLGLLAGAVTLGAALQETHLARAIAGGIVDVTEDLGPAWVLAAIYLMTSIATEIVSNAGAAALMVPIALEAAQRIHAPEKAFALAVAFAASASFATPVGYQTNAFILGPGGYRFTDFVRVGLPLQVLLWLFASLLLPYSFGFL